MTRRRLTLVGIGMGDPDDLTGHAVKALGAADIAFAIEKGGPRDALVRSRAAICDRFCLKPGFRFVTIADEERDRAPANYAAEVRRWHAERAARYAKAIATHLMPGEQGVILVWGDPSLYDSTIRVVRSAERLIEGGLDWSVLAGLSAPQVLAARTRRTLNTIGGSVTLTTGRRLRGTALTPGDSLVVMLDGKGAFGDLPDDCEIAWGAYLGTPDEVLITGRLGDVRAAIRSAIEDGRERHGWIMETYMLGVPENDP